MAKSTREQGYADAIFRLGGCLAENPTVEWLEGFLNAADKILSQVQDRQTSLDREFEIKLDWYKHEFGEVIERIYYSRKTFDKTQALMSETGMSEKYARALVKEAKND